jgi:hypothetical protein
VPLEVNLMPVKGSICLLFSTAMFIGRALTAMLALSTIVTSWTNLARRYEVGAQSSARTSAPTTLLILTDADSFAMALRSAIAIS